MSTLHLSFRLSTKIDTIAKQSLLRVRVLTQQYFLYIVTASFIVSGNGSTGRKPPTSAGIRTHNCSGDRH